MKIKITEKDALYYSWLIWKEISRLNKTEDEYGSINHLKNIALRNLHQEGNISDALMHRFFKFYDCPCCVYAFQDQANEDDFFSEESSCKKCPALDIWANWEGYHDSEVHDAPSCEVWRTSPYWILNRDDSKVAEYQEEIDLIVAGFVKLYNLYEMKEG